MKQVSCFLYSHTLLTGRRLYLPFEGFNTFRPVPTSNSRLQTAGPWSSHSRVPLLRNLHKKFKYLLPSTNIRLFQGGLLENSWTFADLWSCLKEKGARNMCGLKSHESYQLLSITFIDPEIDVVVIVQDWGSRRKKRKDEHIFDESSSLGIKEIN